MLPDRKVIVLDIDRTIARERQSNESYTDVAPNDSVLSKLRRCRDDGFYIILYTSREMQLHQGNVGRILAKTAPVLFDWLAEHDVPYDEIHFGKPWAGKNGFYVDDRAVRPSEFVRLSTDEIESLLAEEQLVLQEIERKESTTREPA